MACRLALARSSVLGQRSAREAIFSGGAVIGPGVGDRPGRVYVGANASVGFALIGDRARIHAGAVIGEAGFGSHRQAKAGWSMSRNWVA